MKTWRPASWSQQAREMCDKQVKMINAEHGLIEDVLHLFQPPIVRQLSGVGRRRDSVDF